MKNRVSTWAGLLLMLTAMTPLPAQVGSKPLDMKLLVLSADGTEPSFDAMKQLLNHLGTPYDAVTLRTAALPALSNGSKGFYQGVVLSTGNLTYFDSATNSYKSALTTDNWTALDTYMRDYKVRLVSYYTWPEARYGLSYVSAVSPTDAAPAQLVLQAAGKTVFPYLTENPLKVANAYTYLAAAAPAAGEKTTPLLTINARVAAAIHTKADGREYLAMTMDHSPYLLHSLATHYGLINWLTRGVFLGVRRHVLIPQNDDLFLSSDQFVANNPACHPVGAAADPTYDPATACPTLRIAAADLQRLATWQDGVRGRAQFRNFRVAHAFNGFGVTTDSGAAANDPLAATAKSIRSKFYWLSHTYDHENLDCFRPVANSGVCVPVDYTNAVWEIEQNRTIATQLGLAHDNAAMVTPGISGLTNPAFMQAFVDRGMRYVVTDMSRPGHTPAIPNTAILNALQPSVIMVPRRATNIFYNTSSAVAGANGSEPDEYNFLFGPSGVFRLPSGQPFFTTTQAYAQIIDRESDAILTYMLRGELYPLMFHQANFWRYNGTASLFTDLMDAVMTKYSRISKLPVSSLRQSTLGTRLKERLDYWNGGVKGVYTPGVSVTLTATRAAMVPVTGVCRSLLCDAVYNGQRQDRISVPAGGSVTVPYFSFSPGLDYLPEDR